MRRPAAGRSARRWRRRSRRLSRCAHGLGFRVRFRSSAAASGGEERAALEAQIQASEQVRAWFRFRVRFRSSAAASGGEERAELEAQIQASEQARAWFRCRFRFGSSAAAGGGEERAELEAQTQASEQVRAFAENPHSACFAGPCGKEKLFAQHELAQRLKASTGSSPGRLLAPIGVGRPGFAKSQMLICPGYERVPVLWNP